MYYLDLPEDCKSFIKKFDYIGLAHQKNKHDYTKLDTKKVLDLHGYSWFRKKKFKIRSVALLFKIPSNFIGHCHYDTITPDHPHYAFNFVLEGQGIMQWIDNKVFNDNQYLLNHKTVNDSFILDSWDRSMALCKVNTLHRVINLSNTPRYVLSLRTQDNKYPITFEDAYNLLQS